MQRSRIFSYHANICCYFFAFLLHFSANRHCYRYVTKHVFARTLLQEAVSYTLLYKRGDLRLGLSDSGWTGNAAAGFVLSLHRRAEQYRKRDAIATRGADFVGIWIQEGLKTENCVQEQENTLPYRYVLKGASDGLHERAQRYTSCRPLTKNYNWL